MEANQRQLWSVDYSYKGDFIQRGKRNLEDNQKANELQSIFWAVCGDLGWQIAVNLLIEVEGKFIYLFCLAS